MVTPLRKQVTRETTYRYQDRPVIVRLCEGGKMIELWQKGYRQHHKIAISTVFYHACLNTAQAAKEAKAEARRQRKLLKQGK